MRTKLLNQVHQGDSIELLKRFAKQGLKVDLIFADPPYNIGYDYDVYEDQRSADDYLDWSRQWITAASTVLSDDGAFWIAIGDEFVAEIKQVAERAGLHLRSWVIWYYTFGVHCQHKFTRSHTHLLYFVKDNKRFTFNSDDIRVPSARQLVYRDRRACGFGRVPDNTWILRPQDVPEDGFIPEHDTWYEARVAGTFAQRAGWHGCQMPERILERIVRCCTRKGQTVLDPFAGSGSTLVVSRKLGRQWIGMELSGSYACQARARLDAVSPGTPIEGPEDAVTSAPPSYFGRSRKSKGEEKAIIDAYDRASEGFSVDKVLADPVLHAAFVDECSRTGIPGQIRDWNHSLLNLRKNGKLPKCRQKETVHWENMDSYLFASEIALRALKNTGFPSFDEILCDPHAILSFDHLARSIAPGFSPFEYRWAALRLRKDARLWRQSADRLEEAMADPKTFDLDDDDLLKWSGQQAVYVLRASDGRAMKEAYAGETLSLGNRIEKMRAARPRLAQFLPNSDSWSVDVYQDVPSQAWQRRGMQSRLIGLSKPPMNYLELATSSEDDGEEAE